MNIRKTFFNSWIPAYLLFGSLFMISISAFVWNPVGVIIAFCIFLTVLGLGVFAPKNQSTEITN